jgi:hypothetical protein
MALSIKEENIDIFLGWVRLEERFMKADFRVKMSVEYQSGRAKPVRYARHPQTAWLSNLILPDIPLTVSSHLPCFDMVGTGHPAFLCHDRSKGDDSPVGADIQLGSPG